MDSIVRILKVMRLYRLALFVRTGSRYRLAERFYSQFIAKGDLCFDVGAYVGDRTDAFVGLGATSVAIEPQGRAIEHLAKRYRNNPRVIIVPKAVGDKEGEAQLMVCDVPSMSSLSRKWVDGVRTAQRVADCFGGLNWDTSMTVPVTALDRLVEEYGRPAFCKIDVEGFEFQVLKGLTEPIQTISFECNPESVDEAIDCTKHLSRIGMSWFNYSIEESMRFALGQWVTSAEMCDILMNLRDMRTYVDVYATTSAAIALGGKPWGP